MQSAFVRQATRCAAAALLAAASWSAAASETAAERLVRRLQPGRESIRSDVLLGRIRELSDDRYEGRLPATPSGEAAAAWIAEQFKALGLEPGAPDGGYFQPVPLAGIASAVSAEVARASGRESLTPLRDFVAWSPRTNGLAAVEGSDLVFVGYGVTAPEYDWDDFKGADLRGKTLVILVNDPPVPDPKDPSRLDPRVFRGEAMTYYGRWTYKFEKAAALGAAAALIVHETKPAAYPWDVVINSWGHERFDLADNPEAQVDVAGWLTTEAAGRLFAGAGFDYAAAKAMAVRRDFRPVPLKASITLKAMNQVRRSHSRNVVAAIPGADPRCRDEWIVYSAHWDHLGRDTRLAGDQIFNGAVDNASGTAGLLTLAEAWRRQPDRPRRSALFIATTAEEQGLLGARYYASHPLHPLAKTLADFNLDGLSTWGRARDVRVVGLGQSTLDDVLRPFAAAQHRTLMAESMPEKGTFYRADHFEFAKTGVPAMYLNAGVDVIGRPEGWGRARLEDFIANRYHKVSDEVRPDWDLSGALEDLQLLFETGRAVADASDWPAWKRGSEFRAARERSFKEAAAGRR